MDTKLLLFVEKIEDLPADSHGCNMIAKVEWRGSQRKAGFLAKGFEKNYTGEQKVQANGSLSWNEGFDYTCRFKRERSGICKSWIIAIHIEQVQEKAREKKKTIGKAMVDVAEFIQFENNKTIKTTINCRSIGHIADTMLTVKLQLVKLESKDKNQISLTKSLSSNPFSFKPKPYSTKKHQSFKLCLNTTKPNNKGIRDPQGCAQFLTAFKKTKVRPEENFKPGKWERKKLISRDEKIELATDVFLASIDQCSKKASGGSACTVLAAMIADWLHKNPKSLPLQNQFDELVLEGSSKWRNLCGEKDHKAKFSDKHFDLDTVLEAKIGSLMVATENSYVGFFSMDDMPEGFDWIQGDMCFDNIWNNILCMDVTEERIYIVSWNDHFFVLKVESEAIYLIDTLGERLVEGCKQAYILKFDAESAIYRRGSQDLVGEGIGCCKEYIKGFLSAIPLRELQKDIERGEVKQELLHRLLQIDFHCTVPC